MTGSYKHKVIILFLAAMIPALSVAGQAPEEKFAQANNLYKSGDYSGAAAQYKELYNEGMRSENLLYNTGNAYYKAGDIASAILFYERAHLMAPADEDINYNLQIARSKISGETDAIQTVFLVRWVDFISLLLHTNTWAVAALILFIITLASLIIFLTKSRARGRVTPLAIALCAFFLALISIAFSARNNSLVNNNNRAVVMCSILTGTSAPGQGGNEIFVVYSGTTITVEETLGEYYEIRLHDGTKGWVKGDCIEKI